MADYLMHLLPDDDEFFYQMEAEDVASATDARLALREVETDDTLIFPAVIEDGADTDDRMVVTDLTEDG